MMEKYFEYGKKELDYLKNKDKRLKEVIENVGMIKRKIDPDLFVSLIYTIIGQQISTKAHQTVWQRFVDKHIYITPETISSSDIETIQSCGMSYRKASYVLGAAQKAASGELDIEALYDMTDEEILKSLTSLNGIGIWTAEMLMLFSMGRMDIFSYGDLAIHRGLKIIYRHRKVPRELFEKYRRRYSPYGSVASLYIWAAAGGALEQIAELP